ncbi:MAG: divergent polysaccharide deacetylase family protein [Alphaproteobacteria bacterium]|nr:divergent polysaccharide deacetylase family protein [Alphaproteobacteria bacterium]
MITKKQIRRWKMLSSVYKIVVFLLLITFVSIIYIMSGSDYGSLEVTKSDEVYITVEEPVVVEVVPSADLESFVPAEPVVDLVAEELFTYDEEVSLEDENLLDSSWEALNGAYLVSEEKSLEVVSEANEESVIDSVVEEQEEVVVKSTNISIVLTDISSENIDSVIKYLANNKEIGLAFKNGNFEAMKKAKEAGFDNLIVSITMEPFNESISLPELSITTGNSTMENVDVLDTVLDNSYMPIAITNDMGSKVTSKKHINVMKPIMASIKSKDLAFLDSKSNYYSVAAGVAEEYGVPYASNYVFIDKDISNKEAVIGALNELEKVASYKDYVIAMGDYSETVIKALSEWLENVNTYPISSGF